jgi:multisubunit Na+/H+ antiporter MnhG subunit
MQTFLIIMGTMWLIVGSLGLYHFKSEVAGWASFTIANTYIVGSHIISALGN